MPLQAEKTTAVKALAGAIQEKLVLPAEQRFVQTEQRIGKLERQLHFFCGGLAAVAILALVLAVYSFLR